MPAVDRDAQIELLLAWLREHGGEIDPAIGLRYSAEYGYHFVATSDVPEDTVACICPLSLSISALNCVSPAPAEFRSCADSSICASLVGKVSASVVAAFFLAEQKLKGEDSFWYPYINLLPAPEDMTTPMWFDEDDMIWIKGTNLYSATVPPEQTALGLRKALYREGFTKGLAIIGESSGDSQFTWYAAVWQNWANDQGSFFCGRQPYTLHGLFHLVSCQTLRLFLERRIRKTPIPSCFQ
jgi:hypothetical protein